MGDVYAGLCQHSVKPLALSSMESQDRLVSPTMGNVYLSICGTSGVFLSSPLSFILREAIEKFREEMCFLLLKRKKLACAQLFENNLVLNWVSRTSGDSEVVNKCFIWRQKCEHFYPFPGPPQHTDLQACSFVALCHPYV